MFLLELSPRKVFCGQPNLIYSNSNHSNDYTHDCSIQLPTVCRVPTKFVLSSSNSSHNFQQTTICSNPNTNQSIPQAIIFIPNCSNQKSLVFDSLTNQNQVKTNSIISTALPLDENMIDICKFWILYLFRAIFFSYIFPF